MAPSHPVARLWSECLKSAVIKAPLGMVALRPKLNCAPLEKVVPIVSRYLTVSPRSRIPGTTMPASGMGALNKSISLLRESGRVKPVMSAAISSAAAKSCGAAVRTKSAISNNLTDTRPVMAKDPATKQFTQSILAWTAARPSSLIILVTFPGVPTLTGIVTVFERSMVPTRSKVSAMPSPTSLTPSTMSLPVCLMPSTALLTPFEIAFPMSLKRPLLLAR